MKKDDTLSTSEQYQTNLDTTQKIKKLQKSIGMINPVGIPKNNIPNASINIPVKTHDEDCECLEICERLGNTYEKCHKGANSFTSLRCPIIERQKLLQNQKLGKKSRIKGFLLFVGGAIVTEIIHLIFPYAVNFIQSLF